MADVMEERAGVHVLVCDADGPEVSTVQDALDLIGASYGGELVALPVSRLDARFFKLSSGFAGDVMQKFVNYHVKLAIIGDISEHLESSSALRALVRESNRAKHVWFLPDLPALDARLSA
ncbi:protein of unknown function [Saccharopolyspora antimicrobica]|uniref:Uncharacterized protein DUF4180 n=1 Tax=Saccharopolyspora antimicrobica TaxID=455193 RepID=A0A1I5J3R2_9PSEU|nr:DUF4180 domain-containing protein [Saccharopolyspora antimicrobica]RKT81999.1 uncharacterized protein DUF4180 [Saccharopolyspora antimicrobica]SFO67362.1 protein of unknown function [Saccharopolyspora antimicrobica]